MTPKIIQGRTDKIDTSYNYKNNTSYDHKKRYKVGLQKRYKVGLQKRLGRTDKNGRSNLPQIISREMDETLERRIVFASNGRYCFRYHVLT